LNITCSRLDLTTASITKNLSKINFLKSYLSKNYFLYLYILQQFFLYLVHDRESHPHFISLASEKSWIESICFLISNWRGYWWTFNLERYKESVEDATRIASKQAGHETRGVIAWFGGVIAWFGGDGDGSRSAQTFPAGRRRCHETS
jgi:hypothetical protein